MNTIDIQSVGQILVTVTDLDRSLAFYHDALGLELLMRVEGQRMAFLRCGGLRLYLTDSDDGPRSRPLLYYRVRDIRTAADRTVSAGAKLIAAPDVVHRTDHGELWMAFFEDPDDLTFGLMEDVAIGG